MSECFEILAVRYATVVRRRQDNFLRPVDEPDAPMPLDFFVWLVIGRNRLLLVDTGFSQVSSVVRKRPYLVPPVQALEQLGYAASAIDDLAITHLHFDHAGNLDAFPNARIWVQEREIQFATGRCMCDRKMNHFFAFEDIGTLVGRLYAGQVNPVDGQFSLCDGIELHRVGGHTDGLQIVRVRTARGWVVLASDAAHYYENLAQNNPFPAIYDVEEMTAAYRLIHELADGEANIVAGHDPLVRERFPSLQHPSVDAYRIA